MLGQENKNEEFGINFVIVARTWRFSEDLGWEERSDQLHKRLKALGCE